MVKRALLIVGVAAAFIACEDSGHFPPDGSPVRSLVDFSPAVAGFGDYLVVVGGPDGEIGRCAVEVGVGAASDCEPPLVLLYSDSTQNVVTGVLVVGQYSSLDVTLSRDGRVLASGVVELSPDEEGDFYRGALAID